MDIYIFATPLQMNGVQFAISTRTQHDIRPVASRRYKDIVMWLLFLRVRSGWTLSTYTFLKALTLN